MPRIILLLILFFYVTSPLIRVGSFSVNSMIVLSVLSCYWLLAYFSMRRSVLFVEGLTDRIPQNQLNYRLRTRYAFVFTRTAFNELFKVLIIPLFFVFIYIFTLSGINGRFVDFSFVKVILYAGATFPISLFVFNQYLNRYQQLAWKKMLQDLVLVGVIHCILTIFIFAVPGMVEILNSIFNLEASLDLINRGVNYRSYGISSFGGATLSAFYALLIAIDWLFYPGVKTRDIVIKTVRISLLMFGILLSGRTGLVLIAIFFVLIPLSGSNNLSQNVWLKSVRAILILGFVGFLLGVFIRFGYSTQIEAFDEVINRTFEFYFKYQDSGQFATDSTTALLEGHFFYPQDPLEFIFGTGDFGRATSGQKISTDPGITRAIWGAGLIGLMIMFLPNLGFLSLKRGVNDPHLRFLLFTISLIIIPILNLKEIFFFGVFGITQSLWMIALASCQNLRTKQVAVIRKDARSRSEPQLSAYGD